MKTIIERITKRCFVPVLAVGISASTLVGCGTNGAFVVDQADALVTSACGNTTCIAQNEGLYYKTEIEELEYYDVTHTTGYQFNSDGTGVCYGQDVTNFTWDKNEISFADKTEFFVMESDKLTVGDITYDKMKGKLITPNMDEIDPDNVEDGCYQVMIDKNGVNEVEGQIIITAEVYEEDKYDTADIKGVAKGDIIYLKNGLVPINSVQWVDSGCVDINGGSENDGVTLCSFNHSDYFRFIGQYEMDRSYSSLGIINLAVCDDVNFIDSSEPQEDKQYSGSDAISALRNLIEEGSQTEFDNMITVENGTIVEIHRMYVP